MTGILRTWRCLNSRCGRVFDAWQANPACPDCKCVRVDWQPAGGHIGGAAKGADAELRALADIFKLGDLNSAERGRAAKKVPSQAPVPAGSQVHTFGGQFSAAINPQAGAQCVPTTNKVDFKVKATPGNALSPNATYPSIRSNTVVEAAHKS